MKAHTGSKVGSDFTRIMVFGTFDIVHPGHVHFFKQARRLVRTPFLIVSVARDASVEKVKGRAPLYSEASRMEFVRTTGLADKVVLGASGDHMPHILAEEPHILAFGYDQSGFYVDSTEEYLEKNNSLIRVVRLKPHRPDRFKSSILKARFGERGA